jgi:2-O-(6-phospho-alpha-D-mannosyl)-D-glycerate hydrolase
VNSARLYLKRANERAERRLLSVETIAALSALQTKAAFPVSDFRLAWRELLKCQPHDSICGCSCDEVHRDMMVRYEQLHRMLDVLQARALAPFAQQGEPYGVGVINPLPFRRTALVEAPGHTPAIVELEGFAGLNVELEPERPSQPAAATAIETDELRLDAARDGTLTLTDKRGGRSFVGLHGLEDEPDLGDLYNFCPAEGEPVRRIDSAAATVLASGPTVWELELRTATDGVAIRTVARLTSGSRRIEFRTTLENEKPDHRLRVIFPTGAAEQTVRAEGQFAVVHRPVTPEAPKTSWVEPPDPTQHTLGAVALGPLALLTRGLPEYEARDTDLCLTLVRSVGLISRPSNAIKTRPLGAGPQTPTPEGQCLSRHHLEYALLLDADGLDDAALVRASQDYRYGFVTTGALAGWTAALALEGDVVFSCLKGAENGDGLVLRCFNPGPDPAALLVGGDLEISRTRLDETAVQDAAGGAVRLRAGEIVTLWLGAVAAA